MTTRMTCLLLGTLMAWALAGCQQGSPGAARSPVPEAAWTPPPGQASPQVGGGKTRIRAKKGPAWVLDAMRVVWNDAGHKARVEKVDWTLPGTGGGPGIRVQADGAWFKVEQEAIEFEGQVIATKQSNGDRLVVKRLVWDGKQRRFQGTGGVRWTRGQTVLTGERLKASDDLRQVELEGDVQAHTRLENSL